MSADAILFACFALLAFALPALLNRANRLTQEEWDQRERINRGMLAILRGEDAPSTYVPPVLVPEPEHFEVNRKRVISGFGPHIDVLDEAFEPATEQAKNGELPAIEVRKAKAKALAMFFRMSPHAIRMHHYPSGQFTYRISHYALARDRREHDWEYPGWVHGSKVDPPGGES